MSFALLSLWFMAGSLLLFVASLLVRRIRLSSVLPAVGLSLLVLLTLTAVFDNVMIASGLFDYGNQTLLGVRVGLAPIEDFTYPICAVLFVPALWWLAGGKVPAEAKRHTGVAPATRRMPER